MVIVGVSVVVGLRVGVGVLVEVDVRVAVGVIVGVSVIVCVCVFVEVRVTEDTGVGLASILAAASGRLHAEILRTPTNRLNHLNNTRMGGFRVRFMRMSDDIDTIQIASILGCLHTAGKTTLVMADTIFKIPGGKYELGLRQALRCSFE